MTRNERKEKKFINKVFRFIRQRRYVENLQKYRVEFERNLGKLYRSEIGTITTGRPPSVSGGRC